MSIYSFNKDLKIAATMRKWKRIEIEQEGKGDYMMNKRIRLNGLNAQTISLEQYPVLQRKENIKCIWNLYDESEVLENCRFSPYTGEPVEKAEDTILIHNKGVFIEDYVHDWQIKDGRLHIYSRVIKADNPIVLLVELKENVEC